MGTRSQGMLLIEKSTHESVCSVLPLWRKGEIKYIHVSY